MIHRDYMGDETQMKVYDDHIWLWNAGELPQGYNTESLQREHRSILRNKTIASIFFQAGFIEHWGRGFDKVQVAFESNNIPFPQVENQFGGTSVYIQRETESQETEAETTQKSTLKSTLKGTLKGTSKKLVDIVEDKPNITISQVAELLQMNIRGIAKHFQKLQQQGILRRIGPDKGGHWEVLG
jgi:ATP-dependent DNA helicase RecG